MSIQQYLYLPVWAMIVWWYTRSSISGVQAAGVWEPPVYHVARMDACVSVDAEWGKEAWKKSSVVKMNNVMGAYPAFFPEAMARIGYNDSGLMVIFKVRDRFVKSVEKEFNGPVYRDACVEFFFSPGKATFSSYFDLEVNCGGTPLMWYVPAIKGLPDADMREIRIAHSLPAVVLPEITDTVTWTVECFIPFSVLQKYRAFRKPARGDVWRGNLFKTAGNTSNPHYLTWSRVVSDNPNFHLPRFFGILKFE